MIALFYFLQSIAAFCLFVFGGAMIEDQDIIVSLIGMMVCLIGFMAFITFGILTSKEIGKE